MRGVASVGVTAQHAPFHEFIVECDPPHHVAVSASSDLCLRVYIAVVYDALSHHNLVCIICNVLKLINLKHKHILHAHFTFIYEDTKSIGLYYCRYSKHLSDLTHTVGYFACDKRHLWGGKHVIDPNTVTGLRHSCVKPASHCPIIWRVGWKIGQWERTIGPSYAILKNRRELDGVCQTRSDGSLTILVYLKTTYAKCNMG